MYLPVRCTQVRTNAGSIHHAGQQIGCALSSSLSAINHDCDPNAVGRVVGGMLVVAAKREIKEDEEVTISYVDEALPVNTRRQALQAHYQFTCACRRCVRESTVAV